MPIEDDEPIYNPWQIRIADIYEENEDMPYDDDYEDYEPDEDSYGSQYGETDNIHSYSYTPNPLIFRNTVNPSEDTEQPIAGTPYLGMELEISISSRDDGAYDLTRAGNGLIYCKEDGSVRGFEAVTHPMTLEAFDTRYPFQALRDLRTEYGASGHANGIHVHVSRDGFDSDTHIFKWMKLIYRNKQDVVRIARRDSEEWAKFDNNERINHVFSAEKEKGKRSKRAISHDRYSAINLLNEHTFEMRVFRGSLQKLEIMAALELVAASVEYTRQLTREDIAQHQGWDWGKFIAWCRQAKTYPNLVQLDTDTQADWSLAKKGQLKRRKNEANKEYQKRIREYRRVQAAQLKRDIDREREYQRRQAEERAQREADIARLEGTEYWTQARAYWLEAGYGEYTVDSPSWRGEMLSRALQFEAEAQERVELAEYMPEAIRLITEQYFPGGYTEDELASNGRYQRDILRRARSLRNSARAISDCPFSVGDSVVISNAADLGAVDHGLRSLVVRTINHERQTFTCEHEHCASGGYAHCFRNWQVVQTPTDDPTPAESADSLAAMPWNELLDHVQTITESW